MIPRLVPLCGLLWLSSCQHGPVPPTSAGGEPATSAPVTPASLASASPIRDAAPPEPPSVAPPREGPVQRVGTDRVEAEVDGRGADLVLDDGAALHVEESRTPVRVVFARISTKKRDRFQLSGTYSVEASAAAKLAVELPYRPPARRTQPCNVTPYPPLMFEGEVAHDGGFVGFEQSAAEYGPPARLMLRPGYGEEVPLQARFALFDTFPCR